MKDFIIIGNKAVTGGKISLNDLPGSAGRMDVLCRCITAALFISFGMRRDAMVHLVLKGEPGPEKIIRFCGETMRSLNPDERSSGSLIQKALLINATPFEKESTPGVFVRTGNLTVLLEEMKGKRPIYYLKEDGKDILEIKAVTVSAEADEIVATDGVSTANGVVATDGVSTAESSLFDNPVFILGDSQGVFEDDEKAIEEAGASKLSVGPLSLLSSHCITLILNVLDRMEGSKKT
ncbi:MAG: tRNA (pseudouridine(54)-N(1))-methyltransferase TrmY [Methanimicrococcus sp.]|nr:tRNA (pseudouridine(54)-N(1))-methyltransferase TrmY [Methanimicrococcus sp.]